MESISPDIRLSVRRMYRLTVLVSLICFAVTSFVLAPLYVFFEPNILYTEAWWVYLLGYLTEEGMVDLVVFAVCYPATVYAIWRAGFKGALKIPVAFSLITLGKFTVNFFMTSIVDGALPDASEFLSFSLPYIGALYLLEIAQYAVVILLTLWVKRRHQRRLEEAELLKGSTPPDTDDTAVFTFDRLISVKNPVQLSALLMAAFLFAVRVVMHQIYQISLYLTSGYSDGWVFMLLEFISDLIIAVVLYFVALLLLARFRRKDAETAAETAARA